MRAQTRNGVRRMHLYVPLQAKFRQNFKIFKSTPHRTTNTTSHRVRSANSAAPSASPLLSGSGALAVLPRVSPREARQTSAFAIIFYSIIFYYIILYYIILIFYLYCIIYYICIHIHIYIYIYIHITFYIKLYDIMLLNISLYTILYYIILYYIILYYITLHYITLYYICAI